MSDINTDQLHEMHFQGLEFHYDMFLIALFLKILFTVCPLI